MSVAWKVGFHPAFDPEFEALALEVQDELLAFAFDPQRKAILLVAGDKSGIGDGRFYKTAHQEGRRALRSISR